MRRFEPREAKSSFAAGHTSDLAEFLKNSEPPLVDADVGTGANGGGVSRIFGRRRRV